MAVKGDVRSDINAGTAAAPVGDVIAMRGSVHWVVGGDLKLAYRFGSRYGSYRGCPVNIRARRSRTAIFFTCDLMMQETKDSSWSALVLYDTVVHLPFLTVRESAKCVCVSGGRERK